MEIPDDKRRSVEPYLKFLRNLDGDVPLDTRLFHVLYEFTSDDFERLSATLADVGVVAGFSVPAIHLDAHDGIVDVMSHLAGDGHAPVLHGYRHTSFRDTPYDTAHDELSRSLDIVESATGESPDGFHVPFMSVSNGTLRAAADLDIDWVVGRRASRKSESDSVVDGEPILIDPVGPYDLQLLERGLSPTETFRRLEDETETSSLLLCHPNVHLFHDATDAFENWLRKRSYSTPGDLARTRTDGPGLLLDCFPPFRVA